MALMKIVFSACCIYPLSLLNDQHYDSMDFYSTPVCQQHCHNIALTSNLFYQWQEVKPGIMAS